MGGVDGRRPAPPLGPAHRRPRNDDAPGLSGAAENSIGQKKINKKSTQTFFLKNNIDEMIEEQSIIVFE